MPMSPIPMPIHVALKEAPSTSGTGESAKSASFGSVLKKSVGVKPTGKPHEAKHAVPSTTKEQSHRKQVSHHGRLSHGSPPPAVAAASAPPVALEGARVPKKPPLSLQKGAVVHKGTLPPSKHSAKPGEKTPVFSPGEKPAVRVTRMSVQGAPPATRTPIAAQPTGTGQIEKPATRPVSPGTHPANTPLEPKMALEPKKPLTPAMKPAPVAHAKPALSQGKAAMSHAAAARGATPSTTSPASLPANGSAAQVPSVKTAAAAATHVRRAAPEKVVNLPAQKPQPGWKIQATHVQQQDGVKRSTWTIRPPVAQAPPMTMQLTQQGTHLKADLTVNAAVLGLINASPTALPHHAVHLPEGVSTLEFSLMTQGGFAGTGGDNPASGGQPQPQSGWAGGSGMYGSSPGAALASDASRLGWSNDGIDYRA